MHVIQGVRFLEDKNLSNILDFHSRDMHPRRHPNDGRHGKPETDLQSMQEFRVLKAALLSSF